MVYYKKLDNGIRLVVKQMQGLLSVTMGILVGTGARVETDKEDGISHFIEHMMFKGTKKRTSFQISDEMDRIGAQMNAFTGKEYTCYYTKSTTQHVTEAFEILSDLFLESQFPEDEMVKEKGVIVEEINMNEDTPDDLCFDTLSIAYYGERGYGRTILGPASNVKGFTKADVDAYMQDRYTNDNIVISMAGNIDVEKAEALVCQFFGGRHQNAGIVRDIPVELKAGHLFRKKEIEQVHIGLAFPSVARYDKLNDATQILNTVLGGGLSSRLFQTVREEQGLAYTVYSYLSSYNDVGSLVVYAGVNPENTQKAAKAIFDCIDGVKKNGITKDEFERGKEQLVSSLVFAQESTSSQMLLYGKEILFSGEIYDFEKRISEISCVTMDQVAECVNINFNKDKMASALIGNVNSPLKV